MRRFLDKLKILVFMLLLGTSNSYSQFVVEPNLGIQMNSVRLGESKNVTLKTKRSYDLRVGLNIGYIISKRFQLRTKLNYFSVSRDIEFKGHVFWPPVGFSHDSYLVGLNGVYNIFPDVLISVGYNQAFHSNARIEYPDGKGPASSFTSQYVDFGVGFIFTKKIIARLSYGRNINVDYLSLIRLHSTDYISLSIGYVLGSTYGDW